MKPGDTVTWYQQRKWGGKQSVTVVFLGFRSSASARIKVGDEEKTVKLKSLKSTSGDGCTERKSDAAK